MDLKHHQTNILAQLGKLTTQQNCHEMRKPTAVQCQKTGMGMGEVKDEM